MLIDVVTTYHGFPSVIIVLARFIDPTYTSMPVEFEEKPSMYEDRLALRKKPANSFELFYKTHLSTGARMKCVRLTRRQ